MRAWQSDDGNKWAEQFINDGSLWVLTVLLPNGRNTAGGLRPTKPYKRPKPERRLQVEQTIATWIGEHKDLDPEPDDAPDR
jgi:hypothetical protein